MNANTEMSDFSKVAIFVDTLPRDPEVQEHRLKQIAADAVELEEFLYVQLCETASSSGTTVGAPSRRSHQAGVTTILSVNAVAIKKYVLEVQRINASLRKLHWVSYPMPQIVLELSFFNIIGSLDLQVSDSELLLAQTTFTERLHLVVSSTVSFNASRTAFKDLEITLIEGCDLQMYFIHPNFQGGLTILGSSDIRTEDMSVSVHATPGVVVVGDLAISHCALKYFHLDGWKLERALEISNCDLTDFSLTSVELKGNVSFTSCDFLQSPALFLNSIFSKSTRFHLCLFDRAPDFHGAKIHQNTKFFNCRFLAAGSVWSPRCDLHDVAAYRVLKGHFGQQKDSRQETVFYALEQRAERYTTNRDLAEVAISWFQDLVSGYGQSLSRALWIFLAWNALFGLLFQLFGRGALKVKAVGSMERFPGIALSLQNAFNPLALFSEKGIVELHSLFLYFTSLIQALGSLGILALIFLTIRGKFRKGSSSEG